MRYRKYNNKAFGPIVAVSLMIVITAFALTGFQNWYQTYSSNLFTNVESQNKDLSSQDLHFEKVVGNLLYLKNNHETNLTLEKLMIEGNVCDLDGLIGPLNLGIVEIDISNCLNNLSTLTPTVLIVTDKSLIERKIFIKDSNLLGSLSAQDDFEPDMFVSVWDTRLNSSGSSDTYSITLPLVNSGSSSYNFNVDWGDGTNSTVTSWDSSNKSHSYASENIYTLKITGEIVGFRFANTGDKLKLLDIKNWGTLRLGNEGRYFYGCSNLDVSANDILNLTGTTTFYQMFRSCSNFNGDIGLWDTSEITNMREMFFEASSFNQNINSWNTSKVITLQNMFADAISFNQSINSWDTSKVTTMNRLFYGASSFNQPLDNWNVSNVNSMSDVFYGASSFNQPINNWDVSNVTTMFSMFRSASSFNQPLDNWNIENVEIINRMFWGASSFNHSVDNWNINKIINMDYVFRGTNSFNQPLNNWDVSNVTTMIQMFVGAKSFNQPLDNWNVSNVNNMYYMFEGATNFNQDLRNWCVINILVEPDGFAGNSALSTNGMKPIWGTCP